MKTNFLIPTTYEAVIPVCPKSFLKPDLKKDSGQAGMTVVVTL
jgi:hypothetical protein